MYRHTQTGGVGERVVSQGPTIGLGGLPCAKRHKKRKKGGKVTERTAQ